MSITEAREGDILMHPVMGCWAVSREVDEDGCVALNNGQTILVVDDLEGWVHAHRTKRIEA